jgi:nucleoside-diphosphate-sugar epimerase
MFVFLSSDTISKHAAASLRLAAVFGQPRRQVAIIGAAGYIGSRLHARLRQDGWPVLAIDRRRPTLQSFSDVTERSAADLTEQEIEALDVVFYFGGCSGRHICPQEKAVYRRENVEDIVRLARRMQPHQLLVFASTAALAEGSGSRPFSETDALAPHLFDLYTESMMLREEALHSFSQSSSAAPRMVGLRLGTVIGISASQRLDLLHVALVCSAFSSGVLHMQHLEAHRALLSLNDLERVLRAVALTRHNQRFGVFNLQSFDGSVAYVANEVAMQTGALIHSQDFDRLQIGFALNTTKFELAYGFTFEGSNAGVTSELVRSAPKVCIGRDLLFPSSPPAAPCVVCGHAHMVTVLDLGAQPLANDFRSSPAEAHTCPRFPLALARCPICRHTQLSHFVNRTLLFTHYLYLSGTSRTLVEYFDWLAERVVRDSGLSAGSSGVVLELACNDGSQLDKFKAQGWRTFGVDPAANLAALASAKGHAVHVGFWGIDRFPTRGVPFPAAEETNAIVAQNVLAHVLNPVDFLRACASAMGRHTRLYIQTSQCRMLETGEFDTLYHEHVSFFTMRSFDFIARRVGLRIVDFELTPIHGVSCLLTLVRDESDIPSSNAFQTALSREASLGLDSDFSFVLYRAKAHNLRGWLNEQLSQFAARGAAIVGFGAAAKGVVLQHFLGAEGPKYEFEFVVDESPLKRDTFVPGTSVPVRNTDALLGVPRDRLLVIVFFAWNFLDEIVAKISDAFIGQGPRRILGVVPFPDARVIDLSVGANLRFGPPLLLRNPFRAQRELAVLAPQRRPVVLIMHFFNEAMLLPYFIQHHAPMFDEAVLIDYNSTDASRDIILREAPSTWRVVQSHNPATFAAKEVDREVSEIEASFPGCWKIALTTTEFLVHPALRKYLASLDEGGRILRFRSFRIAGSDVQPLMRFASLVKQRSAYIIDPLQAAAQSYDAVTLYSRFLHSLDSVPYEPGRHSLDLPSSAWSWANEGFVAKFLWTPWPESIPRKMQIAAQIPQSDFDANAGRHHQVNADLGRLKRSREEALSTSVFHDFSIPANASAIERQAAQDWYETCRGTVLLDAVVL